MVRIACAGETDPGLTHFSRKRQSLGSTTGVIHAKIRIVEDERNLTTVEGPRPAVKHWSLPSEQVDVRRRGAQGSLASRLGSRGFAEAIAREVVSLIPLPPADTERSLFGLLCTGTVDYVVEPARTRPALPPPSARAGSPAP